jgi:hypothetical protein
MLWQYDRNSLPQWDHQFRTPTALGILSLASMLRTVDLFKDAKRLWNFMKENCQEFILVATEIEIMHRSQPSVSLVQN